MLEFNPHWGAVVGADMGVTHLTASVADMAARVLADREIPCRIEDGPGACLHTVQEQVQQAVEAAQVAPCTFAPTGWGFPARWTSRPVR
ncbi:MAG TPA: ROK family protein [Anaerolineae bacterium]|nr:ROK family protein [Anaerolineae bacterium]